MQSMLEKLNKTNEYVKNPINDRFFMGKEVLSLTQYMIAEPPLELSY